MDTMNKTKHSPLPWRLIETNSDYADPSADSHFLIEADNEMGIALTIHDCVPHERGNAELIVTAVNERERLRKAVRQFVDAYTDKEHQLGNGQARRSFDEFRAALNEQKGK